MASPSGAGRLIGNIIAVIVVILVVAVVIDVVAGWLGFAPFAFCAVFYPVYMGIGMTVAIGLGTIGFALWVLQGFKAGAGATLFFGALFVGVLPMVLPHYLGAAACGG